MPAYKKWSSNSEWQEWSTTGNESFRLIDNSVRLPYQPIAIGYEEVAHWSFGQNYGTSSALHDSTTPNNYVTIPSGSTALSDPSGFLCLGGNGYGVVNNPNDLRFPRQGSSFYMSCWVKSVATNYNRPSFISGYYSSFDPITGTSYAFIIDGDNKFKAVISDVFEPGRKIVPLGGDVHVDLNWHHLLLIFNPNTSKLWFVVDNNWNFEDGLNIECDDGPSEGFFSIGSPQIIGQRDLGFSGYIDELVVGFSDLGINPDPMSFRRMSPVTIVSPVLDTGRDGSILANIKSEFDNPNGSSIQVCFRASDTPFDQFDDFLKWSGYTTPYQVLSNETLELDRIGLYVRGRYQQAQILLNPSNISSPFSDPLQTESPRLKAFEINSCQPSRLLASADASYMPGNILAQTVSFPGPKTIDKVSLNLTINAADPVEMITGVSGTVSFAAANFQSARDAWTFQPISNTNSCAVTIKNTYQTTSFSDPEYMLDNAPKLSYKILFPDEGHYQLWGLGYVESGSLVWSFNGDKTGLPEVELGEESELIRWTRFGTIYIPEGGVYDFEVYLKDNKTVILDQWYFTTDRSFADVFELDPDRYSIPVPLSRSPFTTAVRLRSLYKGTIDYIDDPRTLPAESITSWLPSTSMLGSGTFNYEIKKGLSGVTFVDGVSIEFWQIGGGKDFFAAWQYNLDGEFAESLLSSDYGTTFKNSMGTLYPLFDPEYL